jgi:glyoxalase family protein
VLTDVMGFRLAGEQTTANGTGAVFAVGPGGGGAEVVVEERSDPAGSGSLGAGGVHHVAFRVPNFEEHQSWQKLIADAGLRPTKVIDRFYFRSIYFREPGGVLFELATDGPGFTADEDAEHLGERLSLPPFLENRRPQIEANLKPLGPVRV